jgi:hypothetical protein
MPTMRVGRKKQHPSFVAQRTGVMPFTMFAGPHYLSQMKNL